MSTLPLSYQRWSSHEPAEGEGSQLSEISAGETQETGGREGEREGGGGGTGDSQ